MANDDVPVSLKSLQSLERAGTPGGDLSEFGGVFDYGTPPASSSASTAAAARIQRTADEIKQRTAAAKLNREREEQAAQEAAAQRQDRWAERRSLKLAEEAARNSGDTAAADAIAAQIKLAEPTLAPAQLSESERARLMQMKLDEEQARRNLEADRLTQLKIDEELARRNLEVDRMTAAQLKLEDDARNRAAAPAFAPGFEPPLLDDSEYTPEVNDGGWFDETPTAVETPTAAKKSDSSVSLLFVGVGIAAGMALLLSRKR
jgi:hypothetical protein